ncbi:MAG: response regulator [bacterium]|nr:response regulator [bacterium]
MNLHDHVRDGFQFLEVLKAENIQIPVFILTSDIQEKTRERVMELGAVELLNKPPKYSDVVEKIRSAIS